MYICTYIIILLRIPTAASVLGTSMICTKRRFSVIFECMDVVVLQIVLNFKERHVGTTCLKIRTLGDH
jgi:hypothetical protein